MAPRLRMKKIQYNREKSYFVAWSIKVVPGGLIVKDQKALHEITDFTSPGVLAYIGDDEALMLRVPQGWQYVGVGLCNIH